MSVIPAVVGDGPPGQAAGAPYSPLYDDVYHAEAGAWPQARHVFLGGNGLPGRWHGRSRFVILETGFGLGNNFLATWAEWRRDAARCEHLFFISIEKHPLRREDMARLHGLADADEPVSSASAESARDRADKLALAGRLVDAWPTLTQGLHSLHFDDEGSVPASENGQADHADRADAVEGRVRPASPDSQGRGHSRQRVTLLLCLGDIAKLLPALVAQVDAFYLDGFAPSKNPEMWDEGVLSRLNRLAAPGATAATWSVARAVRDGLFQAGFRVERAPGFGGKRDMVHAFYEPRYTAPSPAGGCWPEPVAADRHAIVIGAGLAGCSAALALCREGWRVTLLDRHDGPASEASGNPGGLFHSVLHGEDGVHARAHRSAALAVWREAASWIDEHGLKGDAKGLLRLDQKMNAEAARALLSTLGLPADHVRWLDAPQARALAGTDVSSGGWFFQQAGWLHPAGMARVMLEEAGKLQRGGPSLLTCLWGQEASALEVNDAGEWRVMCGERVLAQAPSLVLCNAQACVDLLATLPPERAVEPVPLAAVRGQITEWALDADEIGLGVTLPRLPVAGAGYVLPLSTRTMLCGATTHHHDDDAEVREADHRHNLMQAARLGVCKTWAPDAPLPRGLTGRTAWRAMTPDRLPLIGALPLSMDRLNTRAAKRKDQVRLIPRERGARGGLYMLSGLGSRGITWSCLAGELLAHWVTGTPCPIEADLRDAMDPARFLVRRMTKGPSTPPTVQTEAAPD